MFRTDYRRAQFLSILVFAAIKHYLIDGFGFILLLTFMSGNLGGVKDSPLLSKIGNIM